ncbi:MAG: hypothetical protein QXQ20_08280 [Candidatus Nezhaarchaeales archaeon]
MYSLVLDPSALIPCGEKSEEDKEAIRKLGNLLCNVRHVTIFFSSYLIEIYRTKVVPSLKVHYPLPHFQAGLFSLLHRLRTYSTASRGFLCKTKSTESGVKFHILERSRVMKYDVDRIGLTEEEDKEVLRVALASAHQETFLITTDRHFLENINWTELLRRYPNEAKKVKIVKPSDPDLMNTLIANIIVDKIKE